MSLTHFTDSNFKKEVLESKLPVVVDFWANWCGPCKMVAPIVEQLGKEFKDKVKIGKIDVDTNPKTATTYGIMSIPTLMFFKGGKIMDQVVGVLSLSVDSRAWVLSSPSASAIWKRRG
ncbi:MAG: thioredoxin [Omnitrophica WOR_2 bacterium SM23_72]|nr:MAG: thioredoxin [Omnitrophica WOR_2 bacterium SM23_72]